MLSVCRYASVCSRLHLSNQTQANRSYPYLDVALVDSFNHTMGDEEFKTSHPYNLIGRGPLPLQHMARFKCAARSI